MGLEAPVRGRIHTGGGECCKAKFVLAGGDVLGNLLQVCEALDIIGGVTGLFQQGLVGDQAVALDNVADGHGGVAIFQGVRIAGQVAQDLGAGQVIAVILPVGQADRAVDLEQGGRIALGHFAHQSGFVLAGSSGHNGNGNAGLFGVGLCQSLPGFILLGLEVQVVDLAGGSGIYRGRLLRSWQLRKKLRCFLQQRKQWKMRWNRNLPAGRQPSWMPGRERLFAWISWYYPPF